MRLERKIWAISAAFLLSAAAGFAQNQPPDPRTVHPDDPLPPITITQPPNQPGDQPGASPAPTSDAAPANANPQPPVPAGRGFLSPYEPADADPAQAVPDTHTLAGIEPIGIGTMGVQHDLFDPSAVISLLGDSRGIKSNGQTGLAFAEILDASLFYTHLWGHSQFTANYNGGATIYDGPSANGAFQDVVLQQEIDAGRWTFHLLDDFMYSPQAVFGGNGMGGPGLINEFSSGFGSSMQILSQAYLPSEQIETGYARRYRNAAVGEAQYALSRRSAFTVSGTYGVLNFLQSGYISSHEESAQAGYDYELSPKNTIALLADYGAIHYDSSTMSIQDYSAALAFGRKITGRLGVEVAVGPERVHALETRNTTIDLWMPSVHSALSYQRRRNGLTASYIRGLTNGGGVFFGARSDTVMLTGTHQFTHVWAAAITGGYSMNKAITPPRAMASDFNHWYIGVSAGRQINAHARIDFNYGLQKQDQPSFCPVLNCGVIGYDHTIGITANWHLHPMQE